MFLFALAVLMAELSENGNSLMNSVRMWSTNVSSLWQDYENLLITAAISTSKLSSTGTEIQCIGTMAEMIEVLKMKPQHKRPLDTDFECYVESYSNVDTCLAVEIGHNLGTHCTARYHESRGMLFGQMYTWLWRTKCCRSEHRCLDFLVQLQGQVEE